MLRCGPRHGPARDSAQCPSPRTRPCRNSRPCDTSSRWPIPGKTHSRRRLRGSERRASVQHRSAGRVQHPCGQFSCSVREFNMDERDRHKEGLKVRRAVLGETYVERAQAAENEFNSAFQDLITRYAWGEIWARPGLPRKTRSLITIAMIVALNRGDELKMHIRGALQNGVTREELREVLLQTAIYCGVPAANAAFHLAEQVLSETEE